jgi:hypothetical protein
MRIRFGPGYQYHNTTRIRIRNRWYRYATCRYCVERKLTYGTLQLGQRAHPAVQAVDVKQQARLVRLRIPPILALVLV